MIVFGGQWGQGVAQSLVQRGQFKHGLVTYAVFPNGEQRVQIETDVMGRDCVVVQSLAKDPDRALVQLMLLVDALRENGANTVKVLLPFYGYSLQNRHFDNEPISSRVVAASLSAMQPDGVLIVDLHARNILDFFSVPVTELSTRQLFGDYLQTLGTGWSMVAPDKGSLLRAQSLAETCGVPLVQMEKRRDYQTGAIEHLMITEGEVTETVVVTDDIINTGRTIEKVAATLRVAGAKRIIWLATHFLGVKDSLEKVLAGADQFVTTNTIDHGLAESERVKVLDIGPLVINGLSVQA